MSIVGFVTSVELMKYIAAPCFRTFYSHVLKPTSPFHLEEMFLLSLIIIIIITIASSYIYDLGTILKLYTSGKEWYCSN